MQRSILNGRRGWDDVALPASLAKPHPEPLTIEGRPEAVAAQRTGYASSSFQSTDLAQMAQYGSDKSLGLELGNFLEAEPMTREEADAFDAAPMDACFLEMQMFSLSSIGASHQAPCAPSGQRHPDPLDGSRRAWAPYHSSFSGEQGSMSSGNMSMLPDDSLQCGRETDSNRSSFETVVVQSPGQCSHASAAMQSSLYSTAPGGLPGAPASLQAANPGSWPATRGIGQTLEGRRHGTEPCHTVRQQAGMGDQERSTTLQSTQSVENAASSRQPHARQAAALQAFGLPPVQTTPALRQSAMQLALGMDVSRGLNLQSWQYGGGEGPTLSMVLDAMDCRASDAFGQAVDALAASVAPADAAEKDGCQVTQLTSAMIPSPAPLPKASEAVVSMPEGSVKLPALKVEAREDSAQHGNAPPSAPGRCADLQEPCGHSPKGPCRSQSGEVSQRMESLERYRDKKRRRLFSGAKTIRYEKRKVNADRRPRVKGRFVKQSEFDGMQHGDAKAEHAMTDASAREGAEDECDAPQPDEDNDFIF